MGDEALALTRRFVDTAYKPLDDWEDWDVIEQFQPAALRYQIDHLIYTMALQKYARTPAFRGYHDEAMRRLIEKYQQKKVWSYWAYENLWGNFEWNPDPARKQNIMLTGFFALSLGAYQTVTGDYRHQEVGSIEFKWNEKRRYPYCYDTLCASLTSDYLKSPWGLVVCEPNWIYSICNMRGAEGLMIHDRLHGTHYWDMIKDGYFRGMEQEFVRPDGMLNFYRSARTGIGQNGASFSNDLRPVAPHLADRGWTLLRSAFQEQDGKLVTPLIKRDKLLDTGNYSFHPLKSYCYIIDEAREAGDEPAAEAAWDEVKDRIDVKIDDRGWLVVEDASLSSHVALSRALVGRKAGWLDMIEKGMPKEWLEGPQLESVPYPQVLVSRAVTDGQALDAVLRSTNGGGRVAVELSQLRPGGAVHGHGRGRLRRQGRRPGPRIRAGRPQRAQRAPRRAGRVRRSHARTAQAAGHERRGAQERPPRPARHRARDARQAHRRRARHVDLDPDVGPRVHHLPQAAATGSKAMTVTQESAVLIGGRWTPSLDGHTVPVISPATEEPVAHVTLGGAQDMERAILAAREAFDEGPWPRMSPHERAQVLARASELLMERHDELAETHHAGGRHADQADDALARDQRARHARRPRGDGRDLPVGGDPRRHALAGRDPPGAGRRRRGDRALERPLLAHGGEARARAAHRLHGRAQARRGDAAQRDRAVGDPHRGRPARTAC